jgi:PST family polysaccharide transporter
LDRLLVRNVVVYTATYGVRLLFPLIVTPLLTHVLQRDKFSEYAIINSCIWTSSVFIEFGFYIYGVARVGAVGDERARLRQAVSEITYGKLLLAPVASAVYLVLAAVTGVLFRSPLETFIGMFGMLAVGASFSWYFQGRQRGLFVILSESVPLVVQLSLLLMLVRSPDQLWLVLALQCLGPMTSVAVALVVITRERLVGPPDMAAARKVLREASPYFVERLSYSTYTSIMPSLIVLLSSRLAVADYSVGERFGNLLIGLSTPLSQAALPRVARAASQGDGWRLSIGLVAFIVAATAVCATGVGLAAQPIVDRFLPQGYEDAVQVARIFCVTSCWAALGYSVANFVLVPRGRARVMFISSGLAFVFGIGAQLVLTPRWGASGAAAGRLVSEATVAIVLCAAAARLYRKSHAGPRPVRPARAAQPSAGE